MDPCFSVNRRRLLLLAVLCAPGIGLAASAQARVFVGIGVGVPWGPVWVPPPVYYPPPYYYAPPPPVYYAPPQTYVPPPQYGQGAPQGGQMCYAQNYSCPMDNPVAAGASCYCLGNNGQRVWGRAN